MALSDIVDTVVGAPGRVLDTLAWLSPPVLTIMFINFILLIVIIVKLFNRMTEGFGQDGDIATMYYSPLCGYCKTDIPLFVAMQKKYGDKVKFTMVDIASDGITGITAVPAYIFTASDGTKFSHVGAYNSMTAMETDFRTFYKVDEYERALLEAAQQQVVAQQLATQQAAAINSQVIA